MPESRLQRTRAAYQPRPVIFARLPEPRTAPDEKRDLSVRFVRQYDIKADTTTLRQHHEGVTLDSATWIVPAEEREQNT